MTIILLVNLCPFYRVGIFDLLQEKLHTKIGLYGTGKEKLWEQKNPLFVDKRFHILPSGNLLTRSIHFYNFLKNNQPDIIIKSIDGKLEVLITFLYSKITRRPFILWTGVWYLPKGLKGSIRRTISGLIYKHSNAIVVYGKNVLLHLKSFKINLDKIFIAPNSTNNEFYSRSIDQKPHIFIDNKPIILFVGRLENQKGVDDLIEIIPRCLNLNFIIIGDGSLNEEVKSKTKNLRNVKYFGYKPKDQLIKYYSICDALIMPSKTEKSIRELWGYVINEAMLQKKAIIASDTVGGAIGGLIKPGINGFIFKEGDVLQLENILKKLKKTQLSAMGQQSWKIIQGWNYDAMFNGFKQAIDFVNQKSLLTRFK